MNMELFPFGGPVMSALRAPYCHLSQSLRGRMRKITAPKVSGVHRFACLALYRALLRQCARLPITAPTLSTVKPLVQEKFRRYKALQSPSQTLNALKAGYETLDLIHSASQGNQHEIYRIFTLVSESQLAKQLNSSIQRERTKAKPIKPVSRKEQKTEETRAFEKMTARRHPDATPILSRPRPAVTGKRRVPVLVNARGVPFLRIKKPQPMNLSGALRSKLDKRWKRIERRDRLTDALTFAEDEDIWDKLTIGHEEKVSWSREVLIALEEVNTTIAASDLKNKQLAEDMWDVVLAERKLAEEEKQRSPEK